MSTLTRRGPFSTEDSTKTGKKQYRSYSSQRLKMYAVMARLARMLNLNSILELVPRKKNITKYQLEIQLVSFDAEVKNSHLMSGENN